MSSLALGVLVGVMIAAYVFHRRVQSELFLLTLDAMCLMTLVTSFIGQALFKAHDFEVGILFLMAVLIIGEVGLSVWWLRAEARGAEEA